MKKFHVVIALFVFLLATAVAFASELPPWSHVPYPGCEDRTVRVEVNDNVVLPPWSHVPYPGCEDRPVRY
jgi:hypothetical protein